MNENIKYEYKEVVVPTAFTEAGREKNLKSLETKMLNDGWILEKYFNGGFSKKSVATFKRDLEYKPTNKKLFSEDTLRKISIFIVFMLIAFFISNSSESKSKESNEAKSQEPEVSYYKKYGNKTLTEAIALPKGTLKEIAFSYSRENGITEDYYNTMYDCLAHNTYSKSPELTIDKMLEWCKNDYENKENKAVYFNQEVLLKDVSSWDGSYKPLENIIKQRMNDESSYKHIETSYHMVYGSKRPHMIVKTIFSGKNAFGGVVKQEISVKVDAKTKEIYDIK